MYRLQFFTFLPVLTTYGTVHLHLWWLIGVSQNSSGDEHRRLFQDLAVLVGNMSVQVPLYTFRLTCLQFESLCSLCVWIVMFLPDRFAYIFSYCESYFISMSSNFTPAFPVPLLWVLHLRNHWPIPRHEDFSLCVLGALVSELFCLSCHQFWVSFYMMWGAVEWSCLFTLRICWRDCYFLQLNVWHPDTLVKE